MFRSILSKVIGDPNEREIQGLQPLVDEINGLEPEMQALSDVQLRALTDEFKAIIAERTADLRARVAEKRVAWEQERDEDRQLRLRTQFEQLNAQLKAKEMEILDELLPRAYAAVREAARRTVGMRHYDVQLIGGIVLHKGKIAEMKTGEGKTLVATMPLYLNGLTGQGAHLVTVNDYLARRDTQWMGPIYHHLGLTVGLLQQGGEAFRFDPSYTRGKFQHLHPVKRREAYEAYITYGTNNEFGFDYLRDNLALDLAGRVQRELHYAIVDEVDNVLIDEARTPLIISGSLSEAEQEEVNENLRRFARIAANLRPELDYEVDEKTRNVFLTDTGLARMEQEAGIDNIYDEANAKYISYMEQALRSQVLYQRDRDYIKQRRHIILVDEFTGRLMPDRRLSEGLHQAIEAKEGVPVRPRMMTQATITIQNYFRPYQKLAGMTGTAVTEAEEFHKIYDLDVVALPTDVEYMAMQPGSDLIEDHRREDNLDVVVYHRQGHPDEILYYKRKDYPDLVYGTERAKWRAIVGEIEECYWAGRPVLVGTTSVEKSEMLSKQLKAKGIPHEVLNAKNHTQEAVIIALAGEPRAITIATNMAGRGVDIKLGGELSDETIREAHKRLRQRGIDPFRASQAQLYSAIAEVKPDYVRRRNQVLELGGLHIIGTERHEARRTDNQLRGRSGRQGEPGSSRFYTSLEDDLMRRFGGERVKGFMEWTGIDEDIPIEHDLVSKSIERAQTRVEGYNFDIRKHLLEYDDVLNRQRELIYRHRYRILTKDALDADLWEMIKGEVDTWLDSALEEPGHEWELLARLDQIVPMVFAPQDALLPSLGDQTCFPSFTIAFLAQAMADQSPDALRQDLLDTTREAIGAYREHVLEKVIGETWERTSEVYQENLGTYAESLERKIDNYVDDAEERGRPVRNRDLPQYLQRVFLLPLGVKPAELKGLGIGEVKERLLAALKIVYHQRVCDGLIKRVQRQTPSGIKLREVHADLDSAVLQTLLDRAQVNDRTDQLERLMADVKAGRGRWSRGNLIDLLLELNRLIYLNLGDLETVFCEIVATEYDKWAERQLKEIERNLEERMRSIGTPTEDQIVQLLLHVYYTKRPEFSKKQRRRVQVTVPRLPLSFLAATKLDRLGREPLRERVLTQLKDALAIRERIWGRQEMGQLTQQRLTNLDEKAYGDLKKRFGEMRIQGQEERRIADLDEDLYDDIQCFFQIHHTEQQGLSDLDIGDEILQHLSRRWKERARERKAADLDEETRWQAESCLRERGYFQDEEAEERFLRQRPGELSKQLYRDIAIHLGRQQLAEVEGRFIGQLDASVRRSIQDYLKERGRFTDENKVQQFLAYQRLSDLGEEGAYNACLHLASQELEERQERRIVDLDMTTRNWVMGYLEKGGLFTDEAKRRRFAGGKLADLDPAIYMRLVQSMGIQQLSGRQRIGDLDKNIREGILRYLYEKEHLVDQAKKERLAQQGLSDLGSETYEDVRQHLVQALKADLEQREIGELDKKVQEGIRAYLHEAGYFLDESKVQRFRRQKLSDLDGRTLTGLERHFGSELIAGLDRQKFVNLDQEVRESVLQFLDSRGYLTNRSERQRLIQHQSLHDLKPATYDDVAHHLGRQRLSGIRGYSFAELDEDTQQTIWHHLKGHGQFTDDFKIELLPYQRTDEFEPELRDGTRSFVLRKLEEDIAQKKTTELGKGLRTRIERYLDEKGYFMDQAKTLKIKETAAADLGADIYEAITQYLGQRLLDSFKDRRVAELGERVQENLWRHLNKVGYSINSAKRHRYAQLEWGKLSSEIGPKACADLVRYLAQERKREIGHRRVADLADDIRQHLRDYLVGIGYFLDETELAQLDSQTIADLEPEDYEGLALHLGQKQLDEMGDHKLADLPKEMREDIQTHLQAMDYLLNKKKLQAFRERRLADLDEEACTAVLRYLWQQQEKSLREKRISELDDETRGDIRSLLQERSFAADESEMERFKKQRLVDLDSELREDIVRHLGWQQLEKSENKRVMDLDETTRQTIEAFLGQQAMHQVERHVMLLFISQHWIDYLTAIEDLRRGIGLEAFAQRDPLVQYKIRAFKMFEELQASIRRSVVANIFRWQPQPLKLVKTGARQ